jgi:hypothetical protein
MNASDIVRLLNSTHYAPADLEQVIGLCRDFPEFSTAHLLRVRILEALGHEKHKQLKMAAVYSMNRRKLMQLVREVENLSEAEAEPPAEEPDIIHFSEDGSEQANVIIEQHAPYAGTEAEGDLLELDEQTEERPGLEEEESAVQGKEESAVQGKEESAVQGEEDSAVQGEEESAVQEEEESAGLTEEEMADTAEEELSAETLLSSLEKNETEMEEPSLSLDDTPSMEQVDQLEKSSNSELISRFIKDDPGPIRADKQTRLKGDVSLSSIREHDGFITDTLAQIYVKQGLFAKAIYAYEKLSLKYPEKSAYFAAQIEKIRNINH